MKTFQFCFVFIILSGFVGCKDLSDPSVGDSENFSHPPAEQRRPVARSAYPVERMITDNQGRQIEATVLGKEGINIAIAKGAGSTGEHYIVPLERLIKDDQDFFENLGDGGQFSEIQEKIQKKARLAGRIARWHMTVDAAEREAATLDLPLLMAFLVTGNEESAALETKLGFSQDFRNWAATNVVLCMLRIDDPLSNRTTSYTAVEDRNTAAKYGVLEYGNPTLMLVKPQAGTYVRLPTSAMGNPATAVAAVEKAIGSRNWATIMAQEAPIKERAKVNPKQDSSNAAAGGS